jgi:DNA-binding NarL/FixJ family response regulator
MARLSKNAAAILAAAPTFPLSPKQWRKVVEVTGLSTQQARAVELALRDLCNKQIGVVMSISKRTVEDHLEDAGRKMGASGRMQIAMRVLAEALRDRK